MINNDTLTNNKSAHIRRKLSSSGSIKLSCSFRPLLTVSRLSISSWSGDFYFNKKIIKIKDKIWKRYLEFGIDFGKSKASVGSQRPK